MADFAQLEQFIAADFEEGSVSAMHNLDKLLAKLSGEKETK